MLLVTDENEVILTEGIAGRFALKRRSDGIGPGVDVMKKRWPFVLVGVVLLLGIIGSLLVLRRPDTSLVEIVQDGRVLYQIDLAQAEDQTIEVEYDGRAIS